MHGLRAQRARPGHRLILRSELPLTAKMGVGMDMREAQMVCVPGSRLPKLAMKAAGVHCRLWLKCMRPWGMNTT